MPENGIVRKSPIVIIRDLLALQFAASALYFLAASLAYFAQVWRSLALDDIISFQVAQWIFVLLAETMIVFGIFFVWWRHSIRVAADRVEEHEGLLWRRHHIIPRRNIGSVEFRQSLLGKLTNYGTVILKDSQGKELARFGSIPDPEGFVDLVTGHQRRVEDAPAPPEDPLKLAEAEEHERLERKSTLRWDLGAGKVNRALERSALKTVAAFLNGSGGSLLLGIGDDRQAIGLEPDYATLTRKDVDGFVNHFGNIFNAAIGPHLRQHVRLRPFTYQGKECMLVAVAASPRPAYFTDEGREEFFVRTGNGTTALKVSEAAAYIETRWSNK